jgi:hypothetical protein
VPLNGAKNCEPCVKRIYLNLELSVDSNKKTFIREIKQIWPAKNVSKQLELLTFNGRFCAKE